jgi:hypothetical protein
MTGRVALQSIKRSTDLTNSDMQEVFGALRNIQELVGQLEQAGYPGKVFVQFPEAVSLIGQVEVDTGVPLPPDLRLLIENFGGIFAGAGAQGLAVTFLCSSVRYPHPFGGLMKVIDAMWYWDECRDEHDFPVEVVDRMNQEFICFATFDVNENCATHFFYDRAGRFGAINFDQDFRDDGAWEYLLELRSGKNSRPALQLESLLLPCLQRIGDQLEGLKQR